MKKIALLIMMAFVGILTTAIFKTYAFSWDYQEEIETTDVYWSQNTINSRYSVIYSQAIHISADYIDGYFFTTLFGNTNAKIFVESATVSGTTYNSAIQIYNDDENVLQPSAIFPLEMDESEESLNIVSTVDDALEYYVDLASYENLYFRFILVHDNLHLEGSILNLINVDRWEFFDIWQYYKYTGGDPVGVEGLPTTVGNPFNPSLSYGSVIRWTFENNTFKGELVYYQVIPFEITNIAFEDAEFLQHTESIDYYTIKDDKTGVVNMILQFNYYDSDNILLDPDATYWGGFATWNLTTNEFVAINKASILQYLLPDGDNLYAYFYMPGIAVDQILTISGSFQVQKWWKNLFGTVKTNEPYTAFFANEWGAKNSEYLPGYKANIIKNVLISAGVALLLPGLEFPSLLIGGMISLRQLATDYRVLIEQLETVTPSSELRAKMNEKFTEAVGHTVNIPNAPVVQKIHLGNFDWSPPFLSQGHGWTLVEDTFEYNEITYMSKGRVTAIHPDLIGDPITVGEIPEIPVNEPFILPGWVKALVIAVAVPAGIGAGYGLYKALDKREWVKLILLSVIVVAAIVLFITFVLPMW